MQSVTRRIDHVDVLRNAKNVMFFCSCHRRHVILGLASELPISVFSFILDAQTDIDRHADNCLSDHMHVLRRVPKENSIFLYMLRVFVEVEAWESVYSSRLGTSEDSLFPDAVLGARDEDRLRLRNRLTRVLFLEEVLESALQDMRPLTTIYPLNGISNA